MRSPPSFDQVRALDDDALRAWPLPMPSSESDKEDRGLVLVIAGSREMPGAAVLAGTAALRAGAGKLTIASGASVMKSIALAVPEARVVGLPETSAGGIEPDAAEILGQIKGRFDAVLIGPGLQDERATCELVLEALKRLRAMSIILDALAMNAIASETQLETPLLITPHAGEMAHLTGLSKEAVHSEPLRIACDAAARWNATIALKGATTYIAVPHGRTWRHEGGNSGLASSGSGDVLAGIIAGLAARGAPLEQAAAWGVALHARAGERLAARIGPIGYLAREIGAEIPAVLHALAARS
jgi:ADP-dependent NAD(P)H-hydrate dehydratase